MLTRAFSTALMLLCGAGILVSWMPGQFAWHVFQCAVFALLFAWTVAACRTLRPVLSAVLLPLLGIVAWGAVQLWRGWSIYPFATSSDILRWFTWFAILYLAIQCFPDAAGRASFRAAFVACSLALAVVSVFQHFLPNGKIFWLFTPEEAANMGPFLNRDHYASFIALALPVAICQMLRRPRQGWFYALAAAVLYASAVAGASRAGFVLLTLELIVLAMLLALPPRAVLAVAVLIVALGFVVGWDTLYDRLQERDPYSGRRELAVASIRMFHDRPWTGFGLGAWTEAYPAYAAKDFGVFINAAHNDWLQWAVEGGIPAVACAGALLLLAIALVPRAPWAIGIPAVFLHSAIDFPMQGRFLPALLFLILGIAVRSKGERKKPAPAED